ncbi:hypothetical protein HQ496_05600 [bacterium]|nr:hypothetical protein [bacterium]
MNKYRPNILRWATEFTLILISVFLAVFLESAFQDQKARASARGALGQLLGELQEDLTDFDRTIAKQHSLEQDYLNLKRWLLMKQYPADSVGTALLRVGAENLTLFPRKSSWATMVASGQLQYLNDPELVLELGQLYESVYTRIEYNSAPYDQWLQTIMMDSKAIQWHSLQSRPLTNDPEELERLLSSLEWIRIGWNEWYQELLTGFRSDVADAINSVQKYLEPYDM